MHLTLNDDNQQNGLIFVKENIVEGQDFVLDDEKCTKTRSVDYFVDIFNSVGLEIVY